jgi:hypothetical protein
MRWASKTAKLHPAEYLTTAHDAFYIHVTTVRDAVNFHLTTARGAFDAHVTTARDAVDFHLPTARALSYIRHRNGIGAFGGDAMR